VCALIIANDSVNPVTRIDCRSDRINTVLNSRKSASWPDVESKYAKRTDI
jgi:hypothetical protein